MHALSSRLAARRAVVIADWGPGAGGRAGSQSDTADQIVGVHAPEDPGGSRHSYAARRPPRPSQAATGPHRTRVGYSAIATYDGASAQARRDRDRKRIAGAYRRGLGPELPTARGVHLRLGIGRATGQPTALKLRLGVYWVCIGWWSRTIPFVHKRAIFEDPRRHCQSRQ